ncbi:MAG: DUF1802 family protein [bacterium]|nr:DUF1802 family protein [bacterium]
MTETVFLANALCLPLVDLQALVQGKMITAMPWSFLSPGQSFALYSEGENTTHVRFWARCELCKSIDNPNLLSPLSNLTIWKKQLLESKLLEREFFFLAYLRIYEIPQPIQVVTEAKGEFLPLKEPTIVPVSSPVFSESDFRNHTQKLDQLRPSVHPELEELQSIVSQFVSTNSDAKAFEQDIKVFLGWADHSNVLQPDSDMTWIKSIANVGNSSDGDLFEKLVRKSFVELGFKNSNANPQASLDPSGCGGAGGLDFYCEEPYRVVGECKATKTESVPDGTPAQLVKLGCKILQDEYEKCIKIIMAAGELNAHAKQTAIGNKMNVIRPETLQKLVELKARHHGSINLVELKPCLESEPFGEDADIKINGYIDKIWNGIKVRAHIVKAVKQLIEIEPHRTQFEVVEIRAQYNAAFSKHDGSSLDNQIVHEFLIELSSPLAGYLGRVQGTSLQTDRFYFLRDLLVD